MNQTDTSRDDACENGSIFEIPHILKNMSADMLRLVTIEAQLAGHTVLAMLGLSLAIAMLVLVGWLFAGAAVATALAALPAFNMAGALSTVALVHLLVAALAYWHLRSITRDLTFRQSRASAKSLLTREESPPQQG